VEQKLAKAFQAIRYEINSDLSENIWQAIVLRDRHIARIKLWAFSIIGLVSFIGLIPVLKIMLSDLTQSGFYEYLSLIFSSGSIITYWKDFLLLIAESLPVISIISSLTLIFIFFLSIRYALKQIIKGQLMLSF